MADPTELSIAEARDALKRKELSATELARAHLEAIEAANEALNAFVLPTPERALAMAKASDARIRQGEAGALEGIPLGIKDLFATDGVSHHRLLAHPRRLHADLRVDGHRQSLGGGSGDARQAQQ